MIHTNLSSRAARPLGTLLLAVTLASGGTLATASSASAQAMPDNSAFLQRMIGMQQRMYVEGNQAVRAIFWKCIFMSRMLRARGIDPGNCGATPASAEAAIQRLGGAYQRYVVNSQRNMDRTWQANDDYDHRAIQDCTKVYDRDTGYMEWSCPNGNSDTLTGR